MRQLSVTGHCLRIDNKFQYICSMISILGAGRSSVFLVEYLAEFAQTSGRKLVICDRELTPTASEMTEKFNLQFLALDINDQTQLENQVRQSELVISMLPAFMHPKVAELCLKHGCHMATASYISPEMQSLHPEVLQKGLVFINEAGLDPGIDHMSAMSLMDELRDKGAIIRSFRSYCGGLIADEDDGDNPWKYKFSWNPRNVVVAAQGAPAQYLENGRLKILPYQRIFNEPVVFDVEGYGHLEAYPNRDSNHYKELYQLREVHTLVRGTLRKKGYCRAWHVLLMIGLTDDNVHLELPEGATTSDWLKVYLPEGSEGLRDWLKNNPGFDQSVVDKLDYIGLFGNEKLPRTQGTSAQILEELLKLKWQLQANDRDLVVMLHQIGYEIDGEEKTLESVLIVKGESGSRTAMAKTVGLPLAIACRLLLEGKIKERGVVAPLNREIYQPVLNELRELGIVFRDRVLRIP